MPLCDHTLMSSSTRTFWESRRDFWEAQIEIAETALAEASASHVQSYELDTSEGRQKLWEKKQSELNANIKYAYSQYEWWNNRINGKGIGRVKQRRKPGW